jgi:hypothetical protein
MNSFANYPETDLCSRVYRALAEHQQNTQWSARSVFKELHRWTGIFILEFKLEIPNVSLGVDRLRRTRLGQYLPGCNRFGLRREIIISRAHLKNGTSYDVLGTLLHELLHAWQDLHGKPGKRNYHNVQFQRRASDLGLIVNAEGHTQYAKPSPFFDLLEKHGVQISAFVPEPIDMNQCRNHSSKLKLWQCQCEVKVRVGRSNGFRAQCLNCGQLFKEVTD